MQTFEQWAEGRPLGPKNSQGWIMAQAAWHESRAACIQACMGIVAKREQVEGVHAAGMRAGAQECADELLKAEGRN